MKVAVFKYPDGSITHTGFSSHILLRDGNKRPLTEADIIATAEREMLIPHSVTGELATSYRIVDDSQMPQSPHFKQAWTDDNPTDTVDVDMLKARDIQMARIRALRNAKLEELDKEQNMLVSKGEDTTALFTQKQVLRDLPANTDLSGISDPETLANTIPTEVQ